MNLIDKYFTEHTQPKAVTLSRHDADYPESVKLVLKNKAPENLYCLGNLDLLNLSGIGFCGSRKSSDKGIETTLDCAAQVAEHGLNVVSGNAAGVDFAAHFAALKNNGNTILVLPEGINHFRIKKALEPVWDWTRVLVVSQFDPNASWKSFRAMERNRLIIALSRLMIVIEAGETGGTLNAGMATLNLRIPLYVAVYDNMPINAPGNDRLLQLGGKRLTKSRSVGRANLSSLFQDIETSNSNAQPESDNQLGLI